MKVFIGADHRGFKLKQEIIKVLTKRGLDVVDMGTSTDKESCDYPLIGYNVAREVAKSKDHRGILVCMTGIGQAITANKVPGAYAALCYNAEAARLSREHNNANILVLGAKFTKKADLHKIVKTWLEADFEGGRHQRRVDQIKKIEKGLKIKS
ncbi:MAG: ribose 5-phosphate isomerase B [Candidatus Omnitrophica bacterium]|nr:ribose 5-phosphate isomerase B [Candidatus Omnitrophota bacterium]